MGRGQQKCFQTIFQRLVSHFHQNIKPFNLWAVLKVHLPITIGF